MSEEPLQIVFLQFFSFVFFPVFSHILLYYTAFVFLTHQNTYFLSTHVRSTIIFRIKMFKIWFIFRQTDFTTSFAANIKISIEKEKENHFFPFSTSISMCGGDVYLTYMNVNIRLVMNNLLSIYEMRKVNVCKNFYSFSSSSSSSLFVALFYLAFLHFILFLLLMLF